MTIETKLSFSAFCAWHLGSAEKQRPQRSLTLAGMSGRAPADTMDSLGPAMLMASMKWAEEALARAFKSAVKPPPADGGFGDLQQPHATDHDAQHSDDLGLVEATLTRGLVELQITGKGVLVLSMLINRRATCSKRIGHSRSRSCAASPNHHAT